MIVYQFRGVAPWLQTNWDWRAAGNFIAGGTGTGFLAVGALAALSGLPAWPVALIGLAFVGIGLLCVWLEIGRPWRALNVYRHPRTSWMTREALAAIPLFLAGAHAAFWNDQAWLAGAAGLGLVFLYCQARILGAAKGIPAWREPLLLPLMLATAAVEGAGLLLFLTAVAGLVPDWLPILFVFCLVVRFGWWKMYLGRLAGGAAPLATMREAKAFDPTLFWGGHAGPFLLVAVGMLLPGWYGHALMAPAGILAMLGGWGFKLALLTRMAHTQGYAIPRLPSRGAGSPGPGARPGWEG